MAQGDPWAGLDKIAPRDDPWSGLDALPPEGPAAATAAPSPPQGLGSAFTRSLSRAQARNVSGFGESAAFAGVEDVVRGAELGSGAAAEFGGKLLQRIRNLYAPGETTQAEQARRMAGAGEIGRALTAQGLTHPEPTTIPGKILEAVGGVAPALVGGPEAAVPYLALQAGHSIEAVHDQILKATGSDVKANEAALAQVPLEGLQFLPILRILTGNPEARPLILKALEGVRDAVVGPGSARVLGEVAAEQISKEDRADLGAALKRGVAAAGQDLKVNAPLFAFLSGMTGKTGPEPTPAAATADKLAGGQEPTPHTSGTTPKIPGTQIPASLESGPSTPIQGEHPNLPPEAAALPQEMSAEEGHAALAQAEHDRIVQAAKGYMENPTPQARVELAEVAQPKTENLGISPAERPLRQPGEVQAAAAPTTPEPPATASELAGSVRSSLGPTPEESAAAASFSEPQNPAPSPTSTKNAIVDEERATRGLPPAMQGAAREFGPVWDEATKAIDEDPRLPDRLVQELKAKPRAVSDTENAVLLQRQIEVQNEHARVQDQLLKAQESGDDARIGELTARKAALSDQLMDIYDAGKAAGTETGRGLNARRMMANEDFSLAAMETAKRVANQGRPLTPEQNAWLQNIHERLTAAEKAIEDFQAKGPALRPAREKPQGKVLDFISAQADAARARIKARGTRAMAGLDPADMYDKVIVGAEYLAKDVRAFADWSKSMLTEFGEVIRPHLQDIYDRAKEFLTTTPRAKGAMQARETRAKNQIAELQAKIDKGDFSKPPKREPAPPSPELQRLQATLERTRQEYQSGLIKDRLANRSVPEKIMDALAKWRRVEVLSSPTIFAKLSSAAFERMGSTVLEEAVGAGISKLAPGLAKRAPREGGASIDAEAKAITEGVTTGMRYAWQKIRTGKSDLDALFGPRAPMPQTALDFLGHLHGALKEPARVAEFARSFEKRTAWAMRNGLDPTDPMVQTRIGLDAYKDAQRSVFMQDNRLVKGFSALARVLESPNPETGKPNLGGKVLTTLGKIAVPIAKIPTNIVAETAQHVFGSITGSVQAALAWKRGFENLKPAEADAIMRQLKKGSLGLATMALGYFNADKVGGYYTGKRDEKDVKVGGLRIFGWDVPRLLVHNPLLEGFQLGATARRVGDSYRRKTDAEPQGLGVGTIAAGFGLLKEVPYFEEAVQLSKLADKDEREWAMQRTAQSLVVPAGVSYLARAIDSENGEPVKRAPVGVVQGVEEGIPGLRQTLPEKNERPKLRLRGPWMPRMNMR